VELPDRKTFSHAYHHPERIRPDHLWVDWFVEFDRSSPGETKGLEFKEGLWAEKLVIVAVLCTIAIITVSIVWCVLGGVLQTVFSVMGFVLSLIAGELAPASLILWTICALLTLRSSNCAGGALLSSRDAQLRGWSCDSGERF
jgi:hypothetical protein